MGTVAGCARPHSTGDIGLQTAAVIGVVPVKVTAENGAIRPGKLLVRSGTPGHAMQAGQTVRYTVDRRA